MKLPSQLLEQAVQELSKLPGVGRRIALRFALYLLRQDPQYAISLAQSIIKLRTEIKHCQRCHALSDTEFCQICSLSEREQSLLCVVADIRDMMAIENTGHFRGIYHILGGVISPIDGIGPEHLSIKKLIHRIEQEQPQEVILALPTTPEGETTAFYLYKQLSSFNSLKISTLSRGIAIGDHIEYADELTLGRAILDRIPFNLALQKQ